ncbi:MAG: hypothetical protein LUC94_12975, partial [Clostridiales bacterium]|nr:hypothetical protein [Clostridiales bacterium]
EEESTLELPDVDDCTGKVLDVLEIEVNDENELLSVVFDTKGFSYFGMGPSSLTTGGMGTGLFTALGLLLITCAVCFLGLKRRGGLLALVLCGSLALSSLTAGTAQAAQNASLTLTLTQTYEGQEVTFSIYQVADSDQNLVGAFADYSDSISLDCEENSQWTELARKLTVLVRENGIPATRSQGTENRTVVFSDIEAGWYLVIGDSASNAIPTPFVICVGDREDMSAIVKVEEIPEETSPSETTEEPEETTTVPEEEETTTTAEAEETTSPGGSSHGDGGSSGGGSSSCGSTSGWSGSSGEGTSTPEEDSGIAGWLPELILSHLPQTGDLTNVILWTSLFAISGGGAILLILTGRTRKHEDDSDNSKR